MSAPTTMQWIRRAARRLSVGSSRVATLLAVSCIRRARALWRRGRDWLGEASGVGWLLRLGVLLLAAAVVRKAVTAIAVGVYERVASGAAPGLLWGAACAWVVAAYRIGREGWVPKEQLAAEEEETGEQEQPAAGPPAEPVGPRLPDAVELVAAVRQIGTPHAHLKALAEYLGTTTERVREAAGAAGLAVTDVRMGGRPSTGVRGDALPSLPSPAPVESVVGAGQPANNDNNNAFTTVPDDVNPVRTHVVWSDRAAS